MNDSGMSLQCWFDFRKLQYNEAKLVGTEMVVLVVTETNSKEEDPLIL